MKEHMSHKKINKGYLLSMSNFTKFAISLATAA